MTLGRKTGGRTKIPIDLAKVTALAATGLNYSQTAKALGISVDTFDLRRKEEKGFAEAYEKGRAKGIGVVANKLFEEATKGQDPRARVTAMIFYLKCHGEWQEKRTVEHTGSVNVAHSQVEVTDEDAARIVAAYQARKKK